MTQPAVSLQIKALEEELGVQVFDRAGAQITLTQAGKVLLRYAKQVNSLFIQIERDIVAFICGDSAIAAIAQSPMRARKRLPSRWELFLC